MVRLKFITLVLLFSLSLSLSFSLFHRLQRGNIQSINIRWRAKIWQNSNENLFIVFKVVRFMDDWCFLWNGICMASDENLFGYLAKGLDRHWADKSFHWCMYYTLKIILITCKHKHTHAHSLPRKHFELVGSFQNHARCFGWHTLHSTLNNIVFSLNCLN